MRCCQKRTSTKWRKFNQNNKKGRFPDSIWLSCLFRLSLAHFFCAYRESFVDLFVIVLFCLGDISGQTKTRLSFCFYFNFIICVSASLCTRSANRIQSTIVSVCCVCSPRQNACWRSTSFFSFFLFVFVLI